MADLILVVFVWERVDVMKNKRWKAEKSCWVDFWEFNRILRLRIFLTNFQRRFNNKFTKVKEETFFIMNRPD